MAVVTSPLVLANVVIRNIVPVAGIVLFHWSAPNILILYFVDSMLSIAVLAAGLMRSFFPPPVDEGWAARVNAEVGYVGGGLLVVAAIAIPLGVPLIFMVAESEFSWRTLLSDPSFCSGLVLQAIAAFWSCRSLYEALRTHTPEQLHVKRQFAFLMLRWVAVLMTMYMGLPLMLGRFAPLFFVAVYVAVSIWIEIAPERFLRAMPGGIDLAKSDGGTTGRVSEPATKKHRRRGS